MPGIRAFIVVVAAFSAGFSGLSSAQTASQEEMRSLDDQVQEIKSDVLAIARDISLLEERLLYPSSTQVAVFVAMDVDSTFRLDSVRLEIDGELATHYIYDFKELEALQNGGVQRVYTGNIPTGGHDLVVHVAGKLASGRDVEATETFRFIKEVEPSLQGLTLTAAGGSVHVSLGDW